MGLDSEGWRRCRRGPRARHSRGAGPDAPGPVPCSPTRLPAHPRPARCGPASSGPRQRPCAVDSLAQPGHQPLRLRPGGHPQRVREGRAAPQGQGRFRRLGRRPAQAIGPARRRPSKRGQANAVQTLEGWVLPRSAKGVPPRSPKGVEACGDGVLSRSPKGVLPRSPKGVLPRSPKGVLPRSPKGVLPRSPKSVGQGMLGLSQHAEASSLAAPHSGGSALPRIRKK
jgi:hypothetical protein